MERRESITRAKSYDIASGLRLERRHCEALIQHMMNEGIISGQTGPMGGYVLAMPGSKLTVQRVADVTASIQIKKGRPSPESAAVAVRGYTKKFFMRIEEFFGKITIAELAQDLDLE